MGKQPNRKPDRSAAAGLAEKLSKLVALFVAILGIPTAAYQAYVHWDKMFPPPPSIEFGSCSQKNIRFTIFNRSELRAVVSSPELNLIVGRDPPIAVPDHSADDPMKGTDKIGPNGDKEFAYPDQVSQYFTKAEYSRGCSISVSALLRYEDGKKQPISESCQCTYRE